MKRRLSTAFALILVLIIAAGCGGGKKYEYSELSLSFYAPKEAVITESASALTVKLSDNLTALVSVSDASEYVGEEYIGLDKSELNIQSGAFNGNLNNLGYVSVMFNYLFEDSLRHYTVCALTQTTFSEEGYHAYRAQFISEEDDLNGFIYMTVQNATCYIFCFYIESKIIDIFDYTSVMEEFLSSVKIG
ncbi:MAG: hypothetical protein GX061_05830 [Eubacteriaceae bacterium]|nr:hypothetical protein [Eubacteriaceae bacterium]